MKSEEEQDRMLLETKIIKDDGYQKQQGKLMPFFSIIPRGFPFKAPVGRKCGMIDNAPPAKFAFLMRVADA